MVIIVTVFDDRYNTALYTNTLFDHFKRDVHKMITIVTVFDDRYNTALYTNTLFDYFKRDVHKIVIIVKVFDDVTDFIGLPNYQNKK